MCVTHHVVAFSSNSLKYTDFIAVCCVFQSQFQFVCEAILRVYRDKEKKGRSSAP